MPSLAIMDKDTEYNKYGPITLVGSRDMIDPKRGTKVFSRDGYTVTFPPVEYKTPAKAALRAFRDKFYDAFSAAGDEYSLGYGLQNKSEVADLISELGDKDGMKLYYLKNVLGKKIEHLADKDSEHKGLAIHNELNSDENEKIFKSSEYSKWIDKQRHELAGEPMVRVGRSLAPFNIDNVTRAMLKNAGTGAEKTVTFGAGKIAAMTAKKFASIAAMHKSEGMLGTSEQIDKALEKQKEIEKKYRSAVLESQKGSRVNSWNILDACGEALVDAADKNGRTNIDALRRAFKYNDFITMPVTDEVLELGVKFLDAIRATATLYFEAKPQRAVMLDEFAGAVVPEGTDPKLVQKLKDAGLQVETYTEGDNVGRQQATQRIQNAQADNVLFQDNTTGRRGQYGMGELGQHVIDLFNSADESTFMHETAHMYFAMLEELAAAYPSSSAAKELATVKEWAEWREGQAAEYKGTRSAVEFQTREDAIKDAVKHGDTVREKALRYEWAQERFARGFEMYLESGEAPAVGLKRVFRSLKKWLTRVYRDVIGAGAMPSSEVKAVMDRMIASDEEIKMMDALRSAEELERLDPDILETDVAKLHEKWKDEALAEAEERMMARLMKDLRKKRDDDEGRRRKELEGKIADDMHKIPCFVAEELVSETGEPESVLTLGYDSVESWEADLEKNGGSYMAEFDRRFNEAWDKVKSEFPTEEELQDRAVEAMAGQYDKVNALEETILQRRIASYNRATGRTGALVREIESEFRAIKKSADNGGFWKLVESKGKVSVTPDSMKAETTALARRKAIDDFMSKHPDGATIKTEIGDTIMNRSSVKASFGHGIYQAKLDALASVPEGLANSIYLGALDDFDGKDIKNHYFIYPIQYGEEKEPRLVFCRVREIDGKRYVYIHDVFSKDSINRAINAENKISEPLQTRYPSKGDFGRFALFKRIIAQYATKHNGGSKIEKLESLITRLKYAKNWTQDERRLVDDIENAIRLEKAKDAGERKYDRAMDAFAKFKAKTVQNQEWVRAMRDEAVGKTKAIREEALAALSALPVSESSKYSMYHAKEMRAAQKAAEALARATKLNLIQSKDRSADAQKAMDEAMKLRHDQSMYAAMVGASVKIARKLNVIERRIERERAAVVKNKKLTADYRYYFDRLLYAYGFSTYMPKRPDALIGENGEPIMFADWYRAESGDDKAAIPALLVSAMDGGEDVMSYKKLSITDVMDIDLMARLLYETGRHSGELLSEGVEGKALDEIETECLDDYHSNVAHEVSKNKIGKVKGALGPYLTTIIKPETVLRLMGGKMGGYIKYIYNVLFDANEKEQQMREAEAVEYQEIISRHYSKDDLIRFGDKLKGAEARPKSSSEPLTKENVIAMALNWGNTQNRARLCVGFDMSEAEVEDIFHEYMTRNDWEFVQDIWDHLNHYGDLVSNVMEKERGVPMKRVEAEPFKVRVKGDVTDVAELRGGYYPIAADPEKNANVDEMQELDMNRASGGAMAFGVGLGSMKNRSASNKIARPILLTLDVINRHVNQQIHIASMRLACRDAYKVLNNKGIAKSIQDTWGNETYKMLKHWVENVWQPPTSNSKIEHVAGWLRSKTVQAIMAYRASTALLNASNIAPMVERLGASGTINALMQMT